MTGTLPAMRISAEEFLALDLEAHALLADVPLRDVSAIDLPDGGEARTVADVLLRMESARAHPPLAVRVLVGLRRSIGRLFGWDGESVEPSFASRLSDDQRRRSLCRPGTRSGPLRLLYQFPNEVVGEARNATVHAFSCMALRVQPSGYRLYWAIYVESISAFTPIYMTLIEPFRRFVVYPAILREIRASWVQPAR
jgi:Protein of unknown function (DUF2867).